MLGRTIGNYEVISQFGEGGMGELYLGRHTRLAREVVIKTIRTEDFSPSQIKHLRERLEREAYTQSQLDHPNIVRVYDFIAVGETTCIVMEFVPGRDLRKMILKETGQIPPERALKLFKQILRAIDYAHHFVYLDKSGEKHQGIIHRDLKPANILVTPEDVVKVTDFGIVKVRGVKGGTQMGFNPGTPEYMSPEQARGRELDHRSDIYSMGIMLYEMLTGRVPFDTDGSGTSDYEIRRGHIEMPVPPLTAICPEIPKELERIVLKSLEKNPDDRFQTARQFLEAIQQYEETGHADISDRPVWDRRTVATGDETPEAPRVYPVPKPGGDYVTVDTVVSGPNQHPTLIAGGYPGAPALSGEPPRRTVDDPVSARNRSVAGRRPFLIGIGVVLLVAVGISWVLLNRGSRGGEVSTVAPVGSAPPGMISIPGGEFRMGRDDGNQYERPAHGVRIEPFYIDRHEVTNEEYAQFIRQTRRNPPVHWREGQYEVGEATLPVVNVSWNESRDYCEWANKRLPTEAEWEYAARGRDSRLYPYGNEWKPRFSNARETGLDKPQAVGSYPDGLSPFGVADMAGNVAEWTETEYLPYPGSPAEPDEGNRVIRGGGFKVPAREQTATERFFDRPTVTYDFVGFRCAKSQETKSRESAESARTP
jgi:serine/threonine protein kinase/formylglycine-generating enzyme required for sulfatase activity